MLCGGVCGHEPVYATGGNRTVRGIFRYRVHRTIFWRNCLLHSTDPVCMPVFRGMMLRFENRFPGVRAQYLWRPRIIPDRSTTQDVYSSPDIPTKRGCASQWLPGDRASPRNTLYPPTPQCPFPFLKTAGNVRSEIPARRPSIR